MVVNVFVDKNESNESRAVVCVMSVGIGPLGSPIRWAACIIVSRWIMAYKSSPSRSKSGSTIYITVLFNVWLIIHLREPVNESTWICLTIVFELKYKFDSYDVESPHSRNIRTSYSKGSIKVRCMYTFSGHTVNTTNITWSKIDGHSGCEDTDVAINVQRFRSSWCWRNLQIRSSKWGTWVTSAITEGGALRSVGRWVSIFKISVVMIILTDGFCQINIWKDPRLWEFVHPFILILVLILILTVLILIVTAPSPLISASSPSINWSSVPSPSSAFLLGSLHTQSV